MALHCPFKQSRSLDAAAHEMQVAQACPDIDEAKGTALTTKVLAKCVLILQNLIVHSPRWPRPREDRPARVDSMKMKNSLPSALKSLSIRALNMHRL